MPAVLVGTVAMGDVMQPYSSNPYGDACDLITYAVTLSLCVESICGHFIVQYLLYM